MSAALIARSPDLQHLEADGYHLEICHSHLIVRGVPYVAPGAEVRRGDLVTTLALAGDRTAAPDTHVAFFSGDEPCDATGARLANIINAASTQELAPGLVVNFTFSSKPANGYPDYYEKMTSYIRILEGPAQHLDPEISARQVCTDVV